jgi:Pyridoxamine 5'-phosphate oxidase
VGWEHPDAVFRFEVLHRAWTELAGGWALLRSQEAGRLAVSIGGRPDIFPINYVVDHGAVVVRAAEGTKLAGAIKGEAVAFEVDGYLPESGEAWSVVVKGHASTNCSTPPACRSSRGTPHRNSGSCGSCPTRSAASGSTSSTGSPLADAPRAATE